MKGKKEQLNPFFPPWFTSGFPHHPYISALLCSLVMCKDEVPAPRLPAEPGLREAHLGPAGAAGPTPRRQGPRREPRALGVTHCPGSVSVDRRVTKLGLGHFSGKYKVFWAFGVANLLRK